jgi:pilus assembly protein Flp/PilA
MLTRIRTTLKNRAADARDRGASAVEYGLMVAAIAAIVVGVVFGLGGLVKNVFKDTTKSITDCQAPTGCPAPVAPAPAPAG